ncbi:hypothetical protein FDI51_gp24 [Lactococcus virus P2]|uniref:Uncharacterized protein n=6 Tax=root TaxID=1 RepID=O21892_BPLSK|nr:hypothetical protein sk1p25 [Lactococcus phage SK1]YP_009613504.1 hypothetical protein FDI51_gp24 [Lactococcus virus P2]YP_764287.1 hypothetical protein LPV712_gp027 [Lactococcus phage 712]YP_764337.1 hypothetical protein LPJV50_ORF23 [Lactococcus virus jj50]AHC30280.1 hypothetical protein sk1833_025 [Lactococcus phage SK1833]ALQ65851.1 hypothetical protein ATN06_27740 [Bacillus thuringiensis]AAB70064.1 unknown [Lactococcus phage SK1]ABB77594.1 hypothetical protein [Lactococcus phage 712]
MALNYLQLRSGWIMENEWTYYIVTWYELKDTGTIQFWKENKTKVYSLSEAHEIKESKEIITGHKAEIRKITEITEIIA